MKVLVLLLAGAALPSIVSSSRQPEQLSARACASYEWTAPETLRGPGNAAMYVESPQVIRRGDTLWLIGSPTWGRTLSGMPLLWPSGDSVTPNFIGMRVPITARGRGLGRGAVIPTPPGVWSISTPRAAPSERGALHVLWRVSPAPSASASDSRTVWTATWQRGRWSQPHVLIDSSRKVAWVSSLISQVTRVGTTPHVFAPMLLTDTVFVLRLTDTGWARYAARMDEHIYSEIAGTERDSLRVFVTYVKQNEIHAGEFDVVANAVVQTALVASFPMGATIRTRALLPGADRQTVVWLESSADDPNASYLRMSESTNRGKTWRAGVALPVRAGSGIMQATFDREGRIHVLFDGPYPSPTAPIHGVWDGVEWRLNKLPARRGQVVPSPSITWWGRDSILAVWAMGESRTSMPVTLWSIGKPCGTGSRSRRQ